MKPIAIYFSVDNEKIYMTKAELEDLIEKVYAQGKSDGQALSPIIPWTPSIPTYPSITWDTVTTTYLKSPIEQ